MSEHITRRHNLLTLYSQFVVKTQADMPGVTVHGLDKDFASKVGIANSSLSTYKSGGRPIGPKIARQIESLMGLCAGWMDESHPAANEMTDDVELAKFLKLATRAYIKADTTQRQHLRNALKSVCVGK